MAAARQSSETLFLEYPIMSLDVVYDGQEKVSDLRHKEATDASYKSGYEDASAQYKQQILDFRSEINELRESTFSQLEGKFKTLVAEAREALMALTYDCVTRALGGFEMNAQAVEKIVESVVNESGLDEERMQIRLHPLDIALLEELETDLVKKHPGLEFIADDSLRRGDCMLSSRFGKVDGLLSTKLEKLKSSLDAS